MTAMGIPANAKRLAALVKEGEALALSSSVRRESRKVFLTQAAHVLYGRRFLPDYPQCLLKMGRFRGAEVPGEIVDNWQEHMNAFAMVREGMAFLERTMPLGARFPEAYLYTRD